MCMINALMSGLSIQSIDKARCLSENFSDRHQHIQTMLKQQALHIHQQLLNFLNGNMSLAAAEVGRMLMTIILADYTTKVNVIQL